MSNEVGSMREQNKNKLLCSRVDMQERYNCYVKIYPEASLKLSVPPTQRCTYSEARLLRDNTIYTIWFLFFEKTNKKAQFWMIMDFVRSFEKKRENWISTNMEYATFHYAKVVKHLRIRLEISGIPCLEFCVIFKDKLLKWLPFHSSPSSVHLNSAQATSILAPFIQIR